MNIILISALLISTTSQSELLIQEYTCQSNQQSMFLDMTKQIQQNQTVSMTYWISAQQNYLNILTINFLQQYFPIDVNYDGEILLKDKDTKLRNFNFQKSQQKSWNFMYLYLTKKNENFQISIFLNNQLSANFILKLKEKFQNLYLIFGAQQLYQKCKHNISYQELLQYKQSQILQINQILELSTKIAKPLYLSKPNKESQYNKFYENILNNHIGPIKNGVAQNTFTYYTSVSTNKNKLKIKQHMISGLNLFLLPGDVLNPKSIDQSYVFVMQYNFYYKDYIVSNYNNTQNHCLYQRLSQQDMDILIRTDLDVNIGKDENSVVMRNFIDQKMVDNKKYEVLITNTDEIKQIPFQYQIVKVQNNPLFKNPKISFRNGYDKQFLVFNVEVNLNHNDRHLFGDSISRNTTRKEYLSFINITEVSFYEGAFIKAYSNNNLDYDLVSGLDQVEYVLTCKNQNDINRIKGQQIDYKNCEKQNLNQCEINNQKDNVKFINCDVCDNNQCQVCNPGYQLVQNICQKCQQGYDPLLKVCYQGKKIDLSQIKGTQYNNINTGLVNDILQSGQMLQATGKILIEPKIYNNNALISFYNNIENQNRIMDLVWQNTSTKQEIYLTYYNNGQNQIIEKLLFGNTADLATKITDITYEVKSLKNFDINKTYYKNFSCEIFGDYYMQMNQQNKLYGQCKMNCQNGYFKDKQTRRCLKCPTQCKTCSSAFKCDSCYNGLILQNSNCVKCVSGCKSCQNNSYTCSECESSKQFNVQQKNCNQLCQNIQYCQQCDYRSGKCMDCIEGFLLENNKCFEYICNIQNCMKCSKNNICQNCNMGYKLENGKCIKNEIKSMKCQQNYQFKNGKCVIIQQLEKSSKSLQLIQSMIIFFLFVYLQII